MARYHATFWRGLAQAATFLYANRGDPTVWLLGVIALEVLGLLVMALLYRGLSG